MKFQIGQEDELPEAASELLKFAGSEKVFLFEGEMGAGKTTLIKSICRQLGMHDTASSPTYSIVNEYAYPEGKIYHFDKLARETKLSALERLAFHQKKSGPVLKKLRRWLDRAISISMMPLPPSWMRAPSTPA